VKRSTVAPRVFFALACAALAGVGGWRAFAIGSSVDPGTLADRLADSGPERANEALRLARLALGNDPASPFRWANLGELYFALQPTVSLDQARACFRRAEQLAPSNPNILMRIANFDYQTGELTEAVRLSYRILSRTRQFDDIVFSSYYRFGVPQAEILAEGVPREPAPARSYLRFVFAHGDRFAATAAWRWASELKSALVTDSLARDYLNLLWREGSFAAARDAWVEFLGARAGDYPRSNRLFNGGFEAEPDNSNPLDWRRDGADGFTIERDAQSMRITFMGTRNLDFHQLGQTQPIAPGSYSFRAMVRTQGLTTDQGPRIRVYDPEIPGRLDLSTQSLTGSSDWHAVELRFAVQAPTRLVRVEVARPPSLKFDNRIAGSLWLDDASLTVVN
jgi:hypothetical protein